MKNVTIILFLFLYTAIWCEASVLRPAYGKMDTTFYKADHAFFQYTGRIDFIDPALPRFSAPGVYIKAAFSGTYCHVILNDEMLWGKSHNYVSVVIDDMPAKRIKLLEKVNVLTFNNLSDGKHQILICKSTESNIGDLEFVGIKCKKIWPLKEPGITRNIEFIGNSITCGTGSDESVIPCDQGEWYDQHNAYMSYGPQTARALQANWMLTAVSGIGLTRSCCNMTVTMPEVFDKVNLRENKLEWNFQKYTPDVVTICLGQNDGVQDSVTFCSAYVTFIERLRVYYPDATIFCLTSPMADDKLVSVMKKYITSVTTSLAGKGDKNVHALFFKKQYSKGCGGHPDLSQHAEIAGELIDGIKGIKGW